MATTSRSSDLIPKEVLDELSQLDTKIKGLQKELKGFLSECMNLREEFSKTTLPMKKLEEAMGNLDDLTQRSVKSQQSLADAYKQREQKAQQVLSVASKEVKEIAQLNKLLNDEIGTRDALIRRLDSEKRALEQVKEERKKLSKEEEKVPAITEAIIRKREELIDRESKHKQAISELQSQITSETKSMQSAEGSMEQLAQKLNRLRAAYKQLSEEQRNSPLGEFLKKEISTLDNQVKNLDGEIGNHQRNVGNYGSAWSKLKNIITPIAGIFIGIKSAIKIAQWAISSTQKTGDGFKFTVQGMKSGLELFKKSIATVDFSLFTQNLQDAIRYGKELAKVIDQLFERTGSTNILIAQNNIEIAKQNAILNDHTKTNKERIEAVEKIRQLEAQNADEVKKNASDLLDATQNALYARIKSSEKFNEQERDNFFRRLDNYQLEYKEIEKINDLISQSEEKTVISTQFRGGKNARMIQITEFTDAAKEAQKTLENLSETEKEMVQFIQEHGLTNDKELKSYYDARIGYLQAEEQSVNAGFAHQRRVTILMKRDMNERSSSYNKITSDLLELHKAEIQALDDLYQIEKSNEAEKNKDILTETKENFKNRMDALDVFLQAQKDAVSDTAHIQEETLINDLMEKFGWDRARAEEEAANQIKLILEKAEVEYARIEKEGGELRKTIYRDRGAEIIGQVEKQIETQVKLIDKGESMALAATAQKYKEGELSRQEYEDEKLRITREAEQKRFAVEISSLQRLIDNEDLTADQREELLKAQSQMQINFAKFTNDNIVSEEEKAARKREEIEKALQDKKKELLNEFFNLASAIYDRIAQNKIKAIEEEMEETSAKYDEERDRIERLEESGAISKEQADARKALVDQQEQERLEELEAQKKEIMRRQAIYQKAMSATQIVINTAAAILSIWRDVPKMDFGISAAALSATVAAIGAAQLATVLAQPIPEYAQGTADHPGGLAVVGDGGRAEMILAGGNIFETPKTDTLIDLPKHAMVLPDFDKAWKAMAFTHIDKSTGKKQHVNIDLRTLESLQQENNKNLKNLQKDQRGSLKKDRYYKEINVRNNLKIN